MGEVLFTSRPGINAPKTLLVEDDIDITDLGEVVWAGATRADPEHGEFHFPDLPSDQLAVYLDETEAHSFRAAKVDRPASTRQLARLRLPLTRGSARIGGTAPGLPQHPERRRITVTDRR